VDQTYLDNELTDTWFLRTMACVPIERNQLVVEGLVGPCSSYVLWGLMCNLKKATLFQLRSV